MSPPSLLQLLGSWWFHPVLLLGLALSGAAYVGAAWRTGRAGRGWPARRTLAFLAGLVGVAVALASGLDGYAEQLLSIHMVQHLVLILAAAPLLVAGRPVTLALRVLEPDARRALVRLLHGRSGRVLAHPVTGLAAIGGAMSVTHFTPLFSLALTHGAVHVCEHLLYLGAGLLFWAVLIPPGPTPRRLDGLAQTVYLLIGMPLMSAVGVILETGGGPRYPEYLAPAARLGVSALADQRVAGTLMWVAGTLVMGTIALGVAWRSMLAEERRAIARDSHADRRAAGSPT